MKYTGTYTLFNPEQESGQVTTAEILGNKITIDWTEGERRQFHLEATTVDRVEFVGTYGEPVLHPRRQVKLRVVAHGSDGEIVASGWWRNTAEDPDWSRWVFRLSPTKCNI